jgi:tRNA pseudouridine38-40 synthase
MGTRFSGFQTQKNAISIQAEVEKALLTLCRQPFNLTGSSRTDAGVHALQNFFHFDSEYPFLQNHIYNLNAILPSDIVIQSIRVVSDNAHARFDAVSREYRYFLYNKKNPFLLDRAWFYPYSLNMDILNDLAQSILDKSNFTSFSKKHTQVNNHFCKIQTSNWLLQNDCLVYNVVGNRFLRGMVRALVSSMVRASRNNRPADFHQLFSKPSIATADFTAPAQGLFLVSVNYPQHFF